MSIEKNSIIPYSWSKTVSGQLNESEELEDELEDELEEEDEEEEENLKTKLPLDSQLI